MRGSSGAQRELSLSRIEAPWGSCQNRPPRFCPYPSSGAHAPWGHRLPFGGSRCGRRAARGVRCSSVEGRGTREGSLCVHPVSPSFCTSRVSTGSRGQLGVRNSRVGREPGRAVHSHSGPGPHRPAVVITARSLWLHYNESLCSICWEPANRHLLFRGTHAFAACPRCFLKSGVLHTDKLKLGSSVSLSGADITCFNSRHTSPCL